MSYLYPRCCAYTEPGDINAESEIVNANKGLFVCLGNYHDWRAFMVVHSYPLKSTRKILPRHNLAIRCWVFLNVVKRALLVGLQVTLINLFFNRRIIEIHAGDFVFIGVYGI